MRMPTEEEEKEMVKTVDLFTECAYVNKISHASTTIACINILSSVVQQVDGDIEDIVKWLREVHKKRIGNG